VTGPHLRLLDRYVNIQPWQNNRVRLQVPEGEVDYINASPIVLRSTKRKGGGEEEEHRYIAMQGPKQVSVGHVWRMVAEQLASPGVIVMLTETHEVGVEKCWQYFPRQKGEVMKLGGVDEFADGWTGEVRCEEVSSHIGDAIEERKLVVRVWKVKGGGRQATPERNGLDMTREEETEEADKMKSPTADIREGIAMMSELGGRQPEPTPTAQESEPGGGEAVEEKVVYHFLYKKWPDFGVPALEDLDSFFALMRLSRERNASPSNPRVVHCSAGVGRSGTFIALEHLMRELDAGVLEDWDEACAAGKAAKAEDGDGETLPDAVGEAEEKLEGDEEEGALEGDGREDLIFDTVNALREQRRTMVQAEAQYAFIYQVMRKLWLERYGRGEGASGREGSGEPAAKRLEVDPFVVP
jgi:protein-tyrosine phosphatase